jgi:hypothetical protein
MHCLPVILNANLITLISVVIALFYLIIVHLPFMHRCTIVVYYGRARASACSDHYVFALFFRIPFFIFFIMVAREQARAATIMFLRCFFVFLFLFFMVAREQARAATIMFLRCFFVFLFFLFLFFSLSRYCRQLIMSKASAYGDEIWQVDSLPQNADRMFISLKSLKGFARGRGEGPQNSIGGSVSFTGE